MIEIIYRQGFQTAVEFRNTDWYQKDIASVTKDYNAAIVIPDMAGSAFDKISDDFIYIGHLPN